MRLRRRFGFCLASALVLLGFAAPAGQAASQPAWSLQLDSLPASIAPGAQGEFLGVATNVGGESTESSATLQIELPAGIAVVGMQLQPGGPLVCTELPHGIECQTTKVIRAGKAVQAAVVYEAPVGSSVVSAQASVSGGGAGGAAGAAVSVPVQDRSVPFSFLPPGLVSPLSEADGLPSTAAASHPYQQTTAFNFPTELARLGTSTQITNSGHPHEIDVTLPPGLIADPAASPVLCTEAQLITLSCPAGSQVGILNVTTIAGGIGINGTSSDALYNMVPPPGSPAMLAANIAQAGIFTHLLGSVRSDSDYGIEVRTPDILALGQTPIYGIQAQIWGDPTSSVHDPVRSPCGENNEGHLCKAENPQKTAFLTLPSVCNGQPIETTVRADSWEELGNFKEARYRSADLGGSPVSVSGCGALTFAPTIEARPTTNLIDSPSGLDVHLHQPQDTDTGHRSTPPLRDAVVTLPPGMVVNPAQADGRQACTEAQIGYLAEDQEPGIHFSMDPASCPDAAKLGAVEVTTPLLAQRNPEHKLIIDPQTGDPLPEPLHGSVYLAAPYDNPVGSLLAIYLDIEDPRTGTVAKLVGKVEPDPQTGQITTRFSDNPQLPIEDIHLELFKGARASLITPPTCGTNTTTTTLTPWSKNAAEGADAYPTDSFQTTATPGGGACPTSVGAAPNAPSLNAGTLGREAGAFSPFVLKISREDGSQRLTRIDTLLPPGLAARFAGVPACTEADIARAVSREAPRQGIVEREDPSCPAASQVGTVDVGAGAGPTPFHASGKVYLAGPYKGAPLSLAIITPAIAGPFDLGTVVSRVAVQVETETAQGHAISDPLPTIIDGIPLDIRSIAIRLDRPNFTLNPTSCEPMAITGSVTSTLGALAPLTTPFQVGNCSALPFKPQLSLRLKGKVRRTAHPRLIATLKAKEGEANIARAQVKLPAAVFLDQAHIKTVCTRVQWAADTCPAGSVYGRAEATTPLLGYPISGSVYLRSSSHKLPDLVVKLKGPASQPIEIDLDGRTDSVKGALRNTFEAVPDAPVSTFRLELFGGKRGLVEMSGGFCGNRKATVNLTGHNGKVHDTRPAVAAKCPKPKKKHKAKRLAHKDKGHADRNRKG